MSTTQVVNHLLGTLFGICLLFSGDCLCENIGENVTITPKGIAEVTVNVPALTGRLHANQMVENPYNRYKITEDEQSQIQPPLKQSY